MLLAPLAIAGPALAQAPTGAMSGGASTPTVQPANGTGQVRQPPENSAMRGSGGSGAGVAGTVNPAGMAGMATGGSGTDMLTLSSGSGTQGSGMGARSGAANGAEGQRDAVSVSDTGVTQRTQAASSGQR